jgi:hypothetical protein
VTKQFIKNLERKVGPSFQYHPLVRPKNKITKTKGRVPFSLNIKEFIAEAWAEFRNAGNPR